MLASFSTALSALTADETAINVVGNNLANLNTVGFKTSAVTFSDLVSQTVGGNGINPAQIGLGVVTGSISPAPKKSNGALPGANGEFDDDVTGSMKPSWPRSRKTSKAVIDLI